MTLRLRYCRCSCYVLLSSMDDYTVFALIDRFGEAAGGEVSGQEPSFRLP